MRVRVLVELLCIGAMVALPTLAGADAVRREGRTDAEARKILERSARFISAAKHFEVEADVAYDVSRSMGSLVESGSSRRITVKRPDRVRVDVLRRDGSQLHLAAHDGQLAVHRSSDDVFAELAVEGGLDQVVDTIIAEPVGGAHRDPAAVIPALGDAIETALKDLIDVPGGELRAKRREKFMAMGAKGLA